MVSGTMSNLPAPDGYTSAEQARQSANVGASNSATNEDTRAHLTEQTRARGLALFTPAGLLI